MEPFQERLGGRIALVSEINIPGGGTVVSYNLHLESRANDDLRLAQLDEVLKDSTQYDLACPMIIAGDLNLDATNSSASSSIARSGFIHTVPTGHLATTPARHLLEPGRHIDWAFVRGAVRVDKGRVHNSIKASDHYPISFDVDLSSTR
jgi:endonuclease/exonuclease/phosphatase family metal-dependent hydrolase